MNLKNLSESFLSNFRMDTLIEGPSNSDALRAANLFVNSLPDHPWLLIISAPVGNGKSHLTGAICNRIQSAKPDLRVVVGNSECNSTENLNCDVLVIDSADLLLKNENCLTQAVQQCSENKISLIINSSENPMSNPVTLDLLKNSFKSINVLEINPLNSSERLSFAQQIWSRNHEEVILAELALDLNSSEYSVRAIETQTARAKIGLKFVPIRSNHEGNQQNRNF